MGDAASGSVLRAEGLGMVFRGPDGDIRLFQDIDLAIAQGETLAILGASGSGKSTLLGLLAGLDVPTEGRVHVGGSELTALDEDQRARVRGEQVGFVFQAFHLLGGLTALENVMMPLELADRKDPVTPARQALEQVGLAERMDHYPNQLSGGEQQRVAIARAFVGAPRVLLADEPTGNLDQATGARIQDLLFELNRAHGTTLVVVTHDPQLAARCHRTLHLDRGQLVAA
ncbi:ABC transporter ATP-binding protein [Aquisalimonas asiatica]|uniref:Putative ABC transport system ATP-binding protein n=1 Tax=Aquisalimonas asiatica TaxID=406100 RepID=A0A1H8VLZ9_9GAMM|nr:ABC transporter ATP-binding protein [Aquisalimonas asiatica]SEP16333.1 putative ABC transport system ATP-binding protein [Aquisalimonas asiatica]